LTLRTLPLGLAALFLTSTLPVRAQEAPPAEEEAREPGEHEPPPFTRHWRKGKGLDHRPPMPPPPKEIDLSKLSPEERRRFEENRKRWEALSPEEKDALRKHHEERRARMDRSIDEAIAESGLTLTGEQRRAFAQRYARERRKIEHELRREMNRKR